MELRDHTKGLLEAHAYDPIPIYLTVQATIVWTDIEEDKDRQVKGITKDSGIVKYPVPLIYP